MLLGVEFYARGAEDPGRGGGLAAGQGAEVKSADPLLRGAGRGQHEDHDWLAGLGDDLAERVAVDAGQVAVEDDDVVGGRVELRRGVQAVVGDVGGESVVSESFGD